MDDIKDSNPYKLYEIKPFQLYSDYCNKVAKKGEDYMLYEEAVHPIPSVEGSLKRIQGILNNSYKRFLIERRKAELAAIDKGFELKPLHDYDINDTFKEWFKKTYPDFRELYDRVGDRLFKEVITVPTRLNSIVLDLTTDEDPI